MATTLFFALIVIVFTNIYPALDKSNSSAGNLTYPENTGSLFQSRLDSLSHFIARVRFASSSQRRIRLAIVAWKTWYAFGVDGRSLASSVARCTVTRLPNFVGLVDYHISLAMGLRPSAVLRAAREAPL